MGLRKQLFLWISTLFFVTFLISFVWENYLTHKDLQEAVQEFSKVLTQQNELKRERIEKFASYLLQGGLASSDSMKMDAEGVLKSATIVLHQKGVLVEKGRVLSFLSEEGSPLPIMEIPQTVIEKMLPEKSGTISLENSCYFFMQLTPIPNMDLHFFLLNHEQLEFALIDQLKSGTKQVLKEISFNMRSVALIAVILVLFLANRLAKKITGPIVHLAKAAQDIGKGSSLELVSLPPGLSLQKNEVGTLCHAFEEMLSGLKEKEKVKAILNKVVSQEIAQEILKGTIHLGGEEKVVTVLFADIRKFTKLTSTMAPHEVIALLNTCMTKISRIIDEHQGVIDKYVGDEVMALFGAPLSHPESALHAVLCALEIKSSLEAWNQERVAKGKQPIEMGIGIHTGLMLAGNMGAENRLNYTVLGSNVNLASRLCSHANPQEILITKTTWEDPSVHAHIQATMLPPVTFKGFDEPITIYKVEKLA